jgi:hypothetical protein
LHGDFFLTNSYLLPTAGGKDNARPLLISTMLSKLKIEEAEKKDLVIIAKFAPPRPQGRIIDSLLMVICAENLKNPMLR